MAHLKESMDYYRRLAGDGRRANRKLRALTEAREKVARAEKVQLEKMPQQ